MMFIFDQLMDLLAMMDVAVVHDKLTMRTMVRVCKWHENKKTETSMTSSLMNLRKCMSYTMMPSSMMTGTIEYRIHTVTQTTVPIFACFALKSISPHAAYPGP